DDRHRRFRPLVRPVEESALPQAGANSGEVIAAHDARERDLFAGLDGGLAREEIKRRLVVYRQGNSRNRAGVDDSGNRANAVQLRVDEGHAPVEVAIAAQRGDKGQQLIAADSEIEL